MGQIVTKNARPKRANLIAIQTGSWSDYVPSANEFILVDTTNSMTEGGEGKFDAYIVGDGTTKARDLKLYADQRMISNDTYILAFTDGEGRVLIGVRKDGSTYVAKGIPEDTRKELNNILSTLAQMETDWSPEISKLQYVFMIHQNDYLTAFVDMLNNFLFGVTANGDLETARNIIMNNTKFYEGEGDDALFHIIDSKRTVLLDILQNGHIVAGNGITLDGRNSGVFYRNSFDYLFAMTDANGKVLLAYDKRKGIYCPKMTGVFDAYTIDNKEYILVFLDHNGNFLCGVKKDGSFVAPKIDLGGIKYIDTPEFMYVILDSDGHILQGITKNGETFIPKGQPEETKQELKAIYKRLQSLEENQVDVLDDQLDWSENHTEISLPFPKKIAKVEIWGVIPANKYNQTTGTLKYTDFDGNTFTVPIMWNTQGNISAGFDKKNFSIDLFKSIEDDESYEVRFGNWVPQDGFHLKALISDFWKIRSLGVYRHAEQISQFRPIENRRPWDTYLGYSGPKSNVDVVSGGEGDLSKEIPAVPLGRPDGFPCMLFINDIPWGLYTWNLKKSKENYVIKKNDDNGKQLFFGDYMTGVFERYNNAYWTLISTSVFKVLGSASERIVEIAGFSTSSGAYMIMESAGVEGMTLTINSSSVRTYPVYYNGNPVTAENTWDAGDCVRIVRAGTSDNYYWNATPYGKRWDAASRYLLNDYCYDEDIVSFKSNGQTAQVSVIRLFRFGVNNSPVGYDYNEQGYPCTLIAYEEEGETLYRLGGVINTYTTMRPSYINWRQCEVRNPKKTICRAFTGLDENDNPTYQYEYYDYDSPSDFASTGIYERTHEIISSDVSQATITSLCPSGSTEKFSKKEYTRSINTRAALDEYSFVIPIIQGLLSGAIGSDVYNTVWGYETAAEAAKAIFDEHHDLSHNIDFFMVYNDCYYADSITHNTLYTMYDGKHLVANLYDTDISMGMGSTYINSFPAVQNGVLAAGNTFVYYLNYFHNAEIKARYAELRDANVISNASMDEIVETMVNSIGYGIYQEELKQWSQPAYRKPVYWRMPAGSLKHIDGIHTYDESLNVENPNYEDWEEGVAYTVNDARNYNGHSYICTAAHTSTADNRPDKAYTCGSPTSGGVFDSPARTKEWYKRRIAYLDYQFAYRTSRPELTEADAGEYYYDNTTGIKKIIMWNGTEWVNIDGTPLE